MLEKLLTGPKTYYLWLLFLLAVIAGCGLVYLQQLQEGLSITGMSRDVSWGLYISQFTYLVGVAASAVMLVLPAYFHHYKKFKRPLHRGGPGPAPAHDERAAASHAQFGHVL